MARRSSNMSGSALWAFSYSDESGYFVACLRDTGGGVVAIFS